MAFFLPRAAFNPARQHGAARHEFAPLWSLLDDTINEVARSSRNTLESSFSPRFDMRETKDTYALEGDLPGIEQKDVSIEFTDEHTLTVKGRTERHHESGTPPSSAGALEQGTSTKGAIKDKDHSHQPSVEDEEDSTQQKQHSTEVATTSGEDKPVANKTEETAAPQHQYWISERSVGSFERSFNFPARVDQDAVKASLKNGVLSIVVPKAKATQSRRINIE